MIYLLRLSAEPLFIEDSNLAHGYKLTNNYYIRYCIIYSIILILYPSTSPNMNLIKKY